MSEGAADGRPHPHTNWRIACLLAAVIIAVLVLVPPLGTLARRVEYVATLQFALLGIGVPALVALGAPWRLLGLAGTGTPGERARPIDRLADRRRRHRELPWSLAYIVCDLGVAIAWHTPGAVSTLAAHGWLAIVEGGLLLVFGLGLWLELVPSPPLVPRSGHLRRAVLGALSMWAFWILAYVTGLSNRGFYRNFSHVAGGLSAAADQQIATAVLWAVAAVTFVPVIFWNALAWLQSEEDPDSELQTLARAERRRGTSPLTPKRGDASPAP
ncbi:MAG TPA: cytochrome c oxidase assembly protein [Acidimicrobiales bacterium]|jgi:cytochrome c oxidase assembly factor CtaG|nr:cytochrome c oxidase assembly protein [Acidimicrobiales bacterium]